MGSHPVLAILLALLLALVGGSGLLRWRSGLSDLDLYMPMDAPVRKAADFVERHFREDVRYESVIVEADNVLEPDVLRAVSSA